MEATIMKRFYPKWFYWFMMLFVVFTITLLSSIGYFMYIILPFKKNIDLMVEGDRVIRDDDIIGFTAAKNSSSFRQHIYTGLSYRLFTDERGARVNSSGLSTANTVTLLTIGCSFSWGHGMENEDTFTEILGRRFGIPVANFAMGSYGTLHSLQMLERNLDLSPKIIIYGFIEDAIRRSLLSCAPTYAPFCLSVSSVAFDPQGNPYIQAPNMKFSANVTQKFYEEVLWDHSFIKDIVWGAKITWFRLISKNMFTNSNTEESRRKCMNFLMKKMEELAKSINANLIVVHIPYLNRGNTNSAPFELINSLDKNTIFIDLSSVIKDYYDNPENPDLRFKLDGHPNQLAHKLIANEIEKVIINNGILLRHSCPN
jgi:hypothetical protein